MAAAQPWHVYILRCADGTLYTGITTDLARRLEEHNQGGALGARYTRSRWNSSIRKRQQAGRPPPSAKPR